MHIPIQLKWLAATLTAITASVATASVGNAEAGKLAYQERCSACHNADFHGAGPAHRGVYGRAAAQSSGFVGYSAALKASGLVWTEPNLQRWLRDPEALVPGQTMGISVPEEQVRTDLIAYLKTLSPKK